MEIRKTKLILDKRHRSVLKDEFCRTYDAVTSITDPESVVMLMDDVFNISEQADEYVYIICMTRKCKPICFFEVSHGSQTKAAVEASSILTRVLLSGATDYIMIHNHPSGDPYPSKDDVYLTERIRRASELVGVNMTDHIVIGRDGYFSFNETNRILDTLGKRKKTNKKKVAE